MAPSRKTPIIVGVGDIVNRSKKLEDATEPLDLMLASIQKAFEDTGLDPKLLSTFQSEIDSLDVIRTWTWPYPDLPSLIAERLSAKPLRKYYSEHGGNQPGYLFDEAARRISKGESKVALLTGGEALASLSACAAAKQLPPKGWTKLEEEVKDVFSPTTRELRTDLGAKHHLGHPIQCYPLFENSFRAHRGQSIRDNHTESARLYAEFARVAAENEYAWNHGAPETEQSIGTVGKKNRMICFPYPLQMNAFNTVNLAAACILTSTERAKELGIPEDRWIYALGGAGTSNVWHRQNFWWNPAISRSLDAGIEISALTKDDIDMFDIYSCFPIVPKLACEHLGLSITNPAKPITLLGGLTSFGGAGNNYSMHALTEMTRQLRHRKGKTGLILANGGASSTYQHVVCLSRSPRSDGLPYPDSNPLPYKIVDVQTPVVEEEVDGEATIETYTVDFSRDGKPTSGHIIGRLRSNGHRFLANHADERTLKELSSWDVEPVGRRGHVKVGPDGRNLFSMDGEVAKL